MCEDIGLTMCKPIAELSELEGKTILKIRKWHSHNNVVTLLQMGFTDGTEVVIASDNPTIGVHLVSDDERVIQPIVGKTLF